MSDTVNCDVCAKQIPVFAAGESVSIAVDYDDPAGSVGDQYDLCMDCWNSIKDRFESLLSK